MALSAGTMLITAQSGSTAITSGTTYTVTNLTSGKCVDAAGAATANGTAVQQYTCNGSAAQQWVFTATDSGYFRIGASAASTQVWDDSNVSSADGSLIHLWAYGGGTNQQWLPVLESGNTYHFVNRFSGKCLDDTGGSTADGTQLQQWACSTGPNQSFTVTAVGSGGGGGTATLLSQGKPAVASSTESASYPASNVDDGSTTTRWSSAFSDPQWVYIDLGATASISKVVLTWEAAYASAFQIQTSNDASTWTSIYSTTSGTGGTQTLNVTGSGRYVRMNGTTRATAYGYSLFEMQVYGTAGSGGGGGGTTPNLGPNTYVFDTSMSMSSIQSTINSIYSQQQSNQFGTNRYALLFRPGTYNLDIPVGFYTQIAGLGANPDDVQINGRGIRVDAAWFNGNATQNFWRSVENFSDTPSNGQLEWAVSQADPFRRIDVHGNMILDDNTSGNTSSNWSSGGFIGDSRVSGQVNSGTQQQFLTQDSSVGSWTGSNWNIVFVGDTGVPATAFPSPGYTTVAQSPTIREKPFLTVDSSNNWSVFVPSMRTNASGPSWTSGTTAGTSIPISQFAVIRPGDTATTMNNALAAGQNLLITPGVYHLSAPLNITRANTVVLGLGLATLVPDNGVTAVTTADVDGIDIAGLLISANTTNSQMLMQVGPSGSSGNHSANPIVLHDVFFRVGGDVAGKATQSLVVNSPYTIIDHTWIWRADHGSGVGWTTNPAANGIVVNGSNVTAYGLMVEHYQQYQTLWNGNNGRTYFYQSEDPYDVPNNASWTPGGENGYPSYKVANSVTSHQAWGVGVYCYFSTNSGVVADRGFEVPATGSSFHDLVTVSLGGVGTISHIINNTGGAVNSGTTVQKIVSGP